MVVESVAARARSRRRVPNGRAAGAGVRPAAKDPAPLSALPAPIGPLPPPLPGLCPHAG